MPTSVLNELSMKIDNVFYWSDSTIVLFWLKRLPGSWTTFVANQIAKIQEAVDSRDWRHVDSHDNPADISSRGALPQDLRLNTFRRYGLKWLPKHEDQWPRPPVHNEDVNTEARRVRARASQVTYFEDLL
ncbi:uncharacterized protein LOC101456754 [Ceratitis capitata]|uniref:uncharacterized protein LOC101456754 n=1 Tax=Ceratitis capitata TaxID=7213 RepID=UPI000329F8B4|nr:uncharacterized protein LOC101456754 [Ceratitis capitata]